MSRKKDSPVVIGCWSAFWGDTHTGAFQLVKQADGLQYLVGDYLAEVTMGILARGRGSKGSPGMGKGGYIAEFVTSVVEPLLDDIIAKNIVIITNGGALNPIACKEALEELMKKKGKNVKIGAVFGDDIHARSEELKKNKKLLPFVLEGEPEEIPADKWTMSLNAYLGAFPIVECLKQGAQIIVTGRCVDSALVLAPLIYEFGWTANDYNSLAAGSLAGHIIECGCQATGGNFTDWKLAAYSENGGWSNCGYPVIEFHKDCSFVVTKPKNTGGIVCRGTVAEQMLYEIGDPSAYMLPDVIADFRFVKIEEIGVNRVKVEGAKGYAPTEFYKVSGVYFDGYKLSVELLIAGEEARLKAEATAEAILSRSRYLLKLAGLNDFVETKVETLGSEYTYGPHAKCQNTREVNLRISVHHSSPEGLKIFGKEVASAGTGMAPGTTGSGGGRPHPGPLIRHVSCLIAKKEVPVSISVTGQPEQPVEITAEKVNNVMKEVGLSPKAFTLPISNVVAPLISFCYGRSGDKGDMCNIGLIARNPKYFPYLRKVVTAEAVKEYLKHYIQGKVRGYELPGVGALNFLLTQSLGGGGLASLRIDRQGKAYAQLLLSMEIPVPSAWVPEINYIRSSY